MPKIRETLEDLDHIEEFFGELSSVASEVLSKLRELRREGYRYGRLPYAANRKRAEGTVLGMARAILEEPVPPRGFVDDTRRELKDLISENFDDERLQERMFGWIDKCTLKQLVALLSDVKAEIKLRDGEHLLSLSDVAINGELRELINKITSGDVVVTADPIKLVATASVGGVVITPKKGRSDEDRQRRNSIEQYGYPRNRKLPEPTEEDQVIDALFSRADLAYHAHRFIRISHEDNAKQAPSRRTMWIKYHQIAGRAKSPWFSNRLAHFKKSETDFAELPIIVDELQDLDRETHKALHDAIRRDGKPSHSRVCIPDLISWGDEKIRLLDYKRMGEGRVLEVQIALGQLGFYRHGMDMFLPEPSKGFVPKLKGSIPKALFRRFRRLEFLPHVLDTHYDEPLDDTILPGYKVPDAVASHEQWLLLFPDLLKQGVGGEMTKSFRERFHKDVPTMGALIACPWADFVLGTTKQADEMKVAEYPLEKYFPGMEHKLGPGLMSHPPRSGVFNILAAFATMKALFGRNKMGRTWYEDNYGHKHWWHTTDREFEELDQKST